MAYRGRLVLHLSVLRPSSNDHRDSLHLRPKRDRSEGCNRVCVSPYLWQIRVTRDRTREYLAEMLYIGLNDYFRGPVVCCGYCIAIVVVKSAK